MDLLANIENSFRASFETGSLESRFAFWREARPALGSVADVGTLIALCRNGDADPRKDPILAALCLEAQRDSTSGMVLCWLLLPGLWEAARELPDDLLDAADVAAELLAGFWEAASTVEENTCEVAGRLVNGARWTAQRAIRKALAWKSRVAAGTPPPERAVYDDNDEDLLSRAVAESIVTEDEIEMLLARRPEVAQLARRLGLSIAVLQARRTRARTRLAAWVKRASRDLHAWDGPIER